MCGAYYARKEKLLFPARSAFRPLTDWGTNASFGVAGRKPPDTGVHGLRAKVYLPRTWGLLV